MHTAIQTPQHATSPAHRSASAPIDDIFKTRLWLDEDNWIYTLFKSAYNTSPTFRFPDLISACDALVFARDNAAAVIFAFPGSELVLSAPHSPPRRESYWRTQYMLLQARINMAERITKTTASPPRFTQT